VDATGVDSTLQSLRAQLGSGGPPEWPAPFFGGPVASIPSWTGEASDAAHSRSNDLDRRRRVLADAHRAMAPIVQDAAQTVTSARSRLDAVTHSWQADKAALAPVAATPSGWTSLLRIDCQDTGESVTMRIVANVNEPRPDVPDGGQKGVITMYPLPGGSGVVEVKPGWTLTPPWVNNNVPIN